MSAHDPGNAIGDLDGGDTLHSAWNSRAMRGLRLRMLSGKRSRLCERCYEMEDLGQDSWRTSENVELASHLPVVGRTAEDGSLDVLNLPYIDIRFSNVCNLKCRICSPEFSSAWHGDAVKLHLVRKGASAILNAGPDPAELMREIMPLLPTLERIHFAGGEPLLSEDHYQVLERLLQLGRTDVRLSYNTNLSRLHVGPYDIVAFWKQFSRVLVEASLDGMDERGDYMRSGQRWPDVVTNRERLLAECPHVEFRILATVGIMNALHVPDFYRACVERGLIKPSEMRLNILFKPRFYSVRALPRCLKDEVEQRYGELSTELDRLGADGALMRAHLEAVLAYMQGGRRWDLWKFRWVTRRLDAIRGESFNRVFPELAELKVQQPS
jgi:pyruvate-formate lyase-activating enzyme